MRDTELADTLRRIADQIDDHVLLDRMLALLNPYARGGKFSEAELANVTRAQVREVNDWRRRHNIVGGVITSPPAASEPVDDLELAAFRSAEERMMDVRAQVDALLHEVTQHVLALEKGSRYRVRAVQERKIGDGIGEIWSELARVRLLMRESDE